VTETLTYAPPRSVAGYLTSDKFINLIVGPIGSTKTTASIMKIAYQAALMAPDSKGIRKSRAVVVRNTREQLRDTTIPDFLRWFPDQVAGNYAKTEYKFYLEFGDVRCEVLFRGLDDANDVRRLLSLQASFGILDEFREINKDIFEALQGRLGRYPSKLDNGVGCVKDDGSSNAMLWAASNPPDMDTFWEKFLTNPPENADVFFQPSGLDPEADWVSFLPDGYYDNLMKGKTDDWNDVYVHAKFGKSLAGQPVFRSFKSDFHIAKSPLIPQRMGADRPLIIGMDFGLNPSVTINQVDPQGRLLTYDALTSDGQGLLQFVTLRLKPLLSTKYAGYPVIIVGDPAGQSRSQTDEKTCFDILRAQGLKVVPARSNSITARVAAVDAWLSRQIAGGPAHLIDAGAVPLTRALRGGYRYKLKKNGEFEDTPEKNIHSHIADAHQYACLHTDSSVLGQVYRPTAQAIKPLSSVGWT
jgi:hypothetical protein